MGEQPLVSVVIPFYSGLEWLKEALNSVKEQNYKNIEVLVINDGSKEDITSISESFKELKISILNKKNGGPASARNLGIEKSRGKYIAFLDSDDVWLPGKLHKQIRQMELEEMVWSHHSYEMFWENSNRTKIINTEKYKGNIYKDCFISLKIQTSTVVVLRKIIIEKNIYFPEHKRYGQDTAFYKQIAQQYRVGYIDGVLSRFRIRGNNAGFRARIQLNERAETWREIRHNDSILNILPIGVIIAYRISYLLNGLLIFTIKKMFRIRDNYNFEVLSKFLYLTPYMIFKFYSKKSR